ncbi:hypothetical protein E2C01_082997 [Portunus trituberculatus]|uniref:Uncharacterized protein n=1 Tax=Portunus trituberculatus TaxID=210409 RepID=A0A5B7IZZ1_PORTR|nr:hypothetical protein [Portunus trituberculatus]
MNARREHRMRNCGGRGSPMSMCLCQMYYLKERRKRSIEMVKSTMMTKMNLIQTLMMTLTVKVMIAVILQVSHHQILPHLYIP